MAQRISQANYRIEQYEMISELVFVVLADIEFNGLRRCGFGDVGPSGGIVKKGKDVTPCLSCFSLVGTPHTAF